MFIKRKTHIYYTHIERIEKTVTSVTQLRLQADGMYGIMADVRMQTHDEYGVRSGRGIESVWLGIGVLRVLHHLWDAFLIGGIIMNENWKELVKVLAESEVSVEDVLTEYANDIGLGITKPQMARIQKLDYRRNKSRRLIEKWTDTGKRIYSISDFPQYAIENAKENDVDLEAVVRDIADNADEIAETWSEFAIINNDVFFSDRGYMYIIMCICNTLDKNVIKQWRDDTGLFPHFV